MGILYFLCMASPCPILLVHTLRFSWFKITSACVSLTDFRLRDRFALRQAVYRKSVRLGAKPNEAHDHRFVFASEPLWS
jgi:hypothetical protein